MDSTNEADKDFFTSDTSPLEQPETHLDREPNDASLTWSASEFLYHQKNGQWYIVAGFILAIIAGLSYLFTGDFIGPIAVVVLGVLLMVGANRKPRTVNYTIDHRGIIIGNREYAYEDFLSFTVTTEGQIESISLYPQKRFAPEVSIYFAPDDGQKVFDILSTYLPFEQREKDRIDKFLHKIHFY